MTQFLEAPHSLRSQSNGGWTTFPDLVQAGNCKCRLIPIYQSTAPQCLRDLGNVTPVSDIYVTLFIAVTPDTLLFGLKFSHDVWQLRTT